MPLQATSGAASYDAFGGGVPVVPNYIEEVFSTFLYKGNGSTQTIINNIDLSTKGGLVWIKNRTGATDHRLTDTVRGATKSLKSNSLSAEATESTGLTAFSTTGFSIGSNVDYNNNASPTDYTSWTFREKSKFFSIVTWTGDGTTGRQISHNLGSAPGCIIIKSRSLGYVGWYTWHRSLGDSGAYGRNLVLDSTAAVAAAQVFGASAQQTSTYWTTGVSNIAIVNNTGETYVAYLFAHDAGGFGLAGTDNVISCGAFTTSGTGNATINLGYEPQWLMVKCAGTAGGDDNGNWRIVDSMRGFPTAIAGATYAASNTLYPNTSGVEEVQGFFACNSTGFSAGQLQNSKQYIYIAIRRGPMKVPTVGTSVFAPVLNTGTGANTNISSGSFAPDMLWNKNRDHAYGTEVWDKLRGVRAVGLTTSNTGAEGLSPAGYDLVSFNNTGVTEGSNSGSVMNITSWLYVNYLFGRAPSFFDVVCYTGTGSATTFNHNLTVVPELMIVKCRSSALPASRTAHWEVYSATAGPTKFGVLNLNINWETYGPLWDNTAPTSSVFTVGTWGAVNASGETYVAYLFATCAGVSKVGSYTGTGALQTINCGFTSGARFVLIRRFGTSSGTGDWYVWDSVRGITSGNDPYLLLNDTAAEVTGTNYVDTDSTGFKVTAAAPAELNNNGSTFIFLAIA